MRLRLAVALAASVAPVAVGAQEACETLAGLAFDDTIISEARTVPAGEGLPEHSWCRA